MKDVELEIEGNRMQNREPTAPTPVFNCVVRVTRLNDGGVRAWVANLDGIESQARTEREALAQVAASFKTAVAKYHAAGQAIPWREPQSCQPGEVERLIAVHL